MIQIERYHPTLKNIWNQFNKQAKNGTFLFDRDYMEYHAFRFEDYSLLFYKNKKLVGLLPLHRVDKIVVSHQGLTFGGIICDFQMRTTLMAQIFETLLLYLKSLGLYKFVYKPIPAVYHQLPAQEDLYALYLHQAVLQHRTVSAAVALNRPRAFSSLRRRCLKKGMQSGASVVISTSYDKFMLIVEEVLRQKYGVSPVHSAAEIISLATTFPDNIKLYAAYWQEEIIGGTLVYITEQVVHLQYIALNNKGKELHALELIIDVLIAEYSKTKTYINFGVSPGNGPYYLNSNLISNKESYGAGAVVQDTYEIEL